MPSLLSELHDGQTGRIVRVGGSGAIRQRLLDMGITRGTTVVLKRRAPLGDPLQITVKGSDLAIRVREARYIQVEILDESEHPTAAEGKVHGTPVPDSQE
ncbi:MAG: FeoA family protein [Phycisphaerae bacterium]